MKFGSFDTAIANSKMTYAEKYKRCSMEDLNMFRDVLGAEVSISADSKRATIQYRGQATDVQLV
jgi:hypothetical protein